MCHFCDSPVSKFCSDIKFEDQAKQSETEINRNIPAFQHICCISLSKILSVSIQSGEKAVLSCLPHAPRTRSFTCLNSAHKTTDLPPHKAASACNSSAETVEIGSRSAFRLGKEQLNAGSRSRQTSGPTGEIFLRCLPISLHGNSKPSNKQTS